MLAGFRRSTLEEMVVEVFSGVRGEERRGGTNVEIQGPRASSGKLVVELSRDVAAPRAAR